MSDSPRHDARESGTGDSARFDRRAFLRGGLSAAVTGLAGCATESGTDGSLDDSDDGSSGDTGSSDSTSPTSPSMGGIYWQVRFGMSAAEYQNTFDRMVDDEGLRLLDVSGYGDGGDDYYAAIWADVAGPRWRAVHGRTASEYVNDHSTYGDQGFRPTCISAYTVGGTPRFAGIFEQYNGPNWAAKVGLTASEYQSVFDNQVADGYRPTDVSGYVDDGGAHYAAIFQQYDGPRWAAHHGLSASGFQGEFDDYVDDGLRLTDVGGFGVAGTPQFVGTWQDFGGPEWYLYYGMGASGFQNRIDDFSNRGFRMKAVSGYNEGGSIRFAGIWERNRDRQLGFDAIDSAVTQYMYRNQVTGLSLAITRDERLIYARGYGYANREAREPMRADHRLRIASISKPITAAAILTLMEDGRLALNDQVFGSGSHLGTTFGTPTHGYTSGGNTRPVTVHHLLQHASGWGHNQSPDSPMFRNPGMNHAQLIQWVLSNRPLQYRPGTQMTYSNFGYSLLGRVIESVTGQDYETYVRNEILQPVGAGDMVIAGDNRDDRRSDEGAYYGSGAYGMPVARMDAHGGWIGSTIDLLRLTVRLDGFPNKSDILGTTAMTELANSDWGSSGYGEGWYLRSNRRFHNGCFNGAVGNLVRRDDGTSFAVLVNTRPPNDGCAGSLRGTLNRAVGNVNSWPSWDLF